MEFSGAGEKTTIFFVLVNLIPVQSFFICISVRLSVQSFKIDMDVLVEVGELQHFFPPPEFF